MGRDKTREKRIKGKVAILIGKLIGGGAERVACNLANYLSVHGYDVDIIVTTDSDETYDLSHEVGQIVLLRKNERRNRLHNIIARQKRLKEYVKNTDVACYIALMPKSAFRMALLKKHINGKLIVSERVDPAHHRFRDQMMMKYASRRCDGLVVQTKEIGEWFSGIKNRIVIPNAINADVVAQRHYPIKKKFVAMGRLEEQKNYSMMIDAFSVFSEKYPEYVLEIYGEGSKKDELVGRAYGCGIEDKVKFMGYTKSAYKQIADAQCFLMTSDYEGMSNALIEAMCIGLPCIATDCDGGGAEELIESGRNGILIKKGAIDEFASAMSRIVEDDTLRENISKEARKITSKLHEDKIYGKWLSFINSLILEKEN